MLADDTNNDAANRAQSARRKFLQKLGVASVLGGVSTLTLLEVATGSAAPSDAVTAQRRWGLLIDTEKCGVGCDACVQGCNKEHGIENTGNDDTDAQWIRKVDLQDKLTGRKSSLPVMCQHCTNAPCVDVCPTGASFRRADGIVLVNKHTCIGCRYCMMACPYKARSFIHENLTQQLPEAPRGKGTVESCTLCVHRIDADSTRQPACAEACSEAGHNAILMGDLNDPESDISQRLQQQGATQVRSDLQLDTNVRYTEI